MFYAGHIEAVEDKKSPPAKQKKSEESDDSVSASDTENMDVIVRRKYEPRISNKWFRGSGLIYDCVRGNFVCVNYKSYKKCIQQRDEDKKNAIPRLRCAPFREFKTQKECFKEQYRQIENQKPKIYCQNPKYY